jgi:hypothetical protein
VSSVGILVVISNLYLPAMLLFPVDGNLEIPAPPKYGDLRLECDRAVVKEFYEAQILQDKAHLALAVKRDLDDLLGKSGGTDVAMQVTEEVSSSVEPVKGAQQISNNSSPPAKESPEALKIKDEQSDVMPPNETASSESPPNREDAPLSNDAATPAEVWSDKKPQENETTDTDVSDPFDFQSALLKDYKDAFERAVDKKGNATYTLFTRDDPDEPPDYLGAGIGATSRHMSSKEREVEYHRWQTTLLARIPEQPTFEELGLEHRVFGLAERRKEVAKLKEKMIEGDKSEADKQISQEKVPIKSDTKEKDDVPMDVEKDDKSSNPSEDAKQEDDKAETSVSDDEGKKEDEVDDEAAKDDEDEGDAPQKVVRPISLIPVPSFYEQDLRRIKNVHADLIHVSLQNHARQRLEESAAEYNTGTRKQIIRSFIPNDVTVCSFQGLA